MPKGVGYGTNAKSKPAGKQKIQAGGSGKMHGFKPVGDQKPGVTETSGSGGGTKWGAKVAGPSGKMAKFGGVKPQKAGITSVK